MNPHSAPQFKSLKPALGLDAHDASVSSGTDPAVLLCATIQRP